MDSSSASQQLRKAVQKLENARAELERPEEDVMAYSICTQVKQSLHGLMRSYLAFREAAVDEPASLHSLFEKCKALCGDFGYLDITRVICSAEKPIVKNEGCLGPTRCMTFEEYERKVSFATSVKDIVFNEMRLSAKDLA